MTTKITKSIIERFWGKVDIQPGGCWLWKGGVKHGQKGGYGLFYISGKTIKAHQMAFKLAKGEIKNLILHSCNTRRCCSPFHLYDGDHNDNVRDALKSNRHRNQHSVTCPYPCNGTGFVMKRGPIRHGEKITRMCRRCKGTGKLYTKVVKVAWAIYA